MAFTFLVEDGTGLALATSYASVEEADDYFEIDIHEQTWPSLDELVKQKLLVLATRLINQRVCWAYPKGSATQALQWPTTTEQMGPDGITIEIDAVPERVKEATIIYARQLADASPSDATQTEGLVRVEVDVIELEFDPDARIKRIPDTVVQLLAGYARERGAGARFGKIKRI